MMNIPKVILEKNDTFKYILILINSNNNKEYFIRGFKKFQYHQDIFNDFWDTYELNENKNIECIGGGRIKEMSDDNKMLIYGYSVSYGQADLNKVKEIILKGTNYSNYDIKNLFEDY